jgi:sporulation protein YlmC with PRC-barrel domain
MRSTMTTTPLVSLKSRQIDLMDTNEDILGRKVVDLNGEEVGRVDDVFVDFDQRFARFVALKSGDVLGLGGKQFLVPVDAIQSVDTDRIVINESKERILAGPEFDPTRQTVTETTPGTPNSFDVPVVAAYEYYAINEPFWSPNYRRPNWI